VRRSTGFFALPAFLSLVALALSTSCADQAEGDRCDPRNGNDDCEGSLRCVRLSEFDSSEADQNVGICCPDSSQASDVCSAAAYKPLPKPPDAGSPDSGS
jgi:hypothetical protein